MHITEKGQVTIPLVIRRALGLSRFSEVEFHLEGDKAYLTKKRDVDAAAERLATYRGRATAELSTDEILTLTRS